MKTYFTNDHEDSNYKSETPASASTFELDPPRLIEVSRSKTN